jgi:hypothetical protein
MVSAPFYNSLAAQLPPIFWIGFFELYFLWHWWGEGVVSEKSGSVCSFVPLTLPSSPTPLGAALRERDGFFPSQFTS